MPADRPDEKLLQSLGEFIVWYVICRLNGAPAQFGDLAASGPPAGNANTRPAPAANGQASAATVAAPKSAADSTKDRPRLIEQIHAKLLAKAPPYHAPIPTNTLIKRAGYKVNSWSRDKVTDLCVWGDLYRHPRNRGVSLPCTER